MMTLEKLIEIFNSENLQWRRVNDQPCVHTFYGDYYINLCLWHLSGEEVVSIDVDDLDKCIDDIVSVDLKASDENFQFHKDLFVEAKKEAINIAA